MAAETSYAYGDGPDSGKKKGGFWRKAFILLTLLFGLMLLGLIVRSWSMSRALTNEAFESASSQAIAAAEQLERDFTLAKTITEDLARDLTDGTLAYDDIEERLKGLLALEPGLDGITVAFGRGEYSTDYDLFLVYVWRDESGALQTQVGESRYDYTLPPSGDAAAAQTEWYYSPIHSGPTWTDPFLAAGAGRVLIEFGMPFSSPEDQSGEPIGVVATDYSLEGMRSLVADLDLGLTGFGAVYAPTGAWLSHPIPERVVEGNIFEDEELQDENFQAAARRALAGDTVSIRRRAQTEEVWNFFTPVVNTDWALVVQLSESEFLLGRDLLLHYQVAIVLVAGLFLFFVLGVLLHFDQGTRDRLWLASVSFSVIGVIMIVAIIVLSRNMPASFGDGRLVTSQAALRRYEHALAQTYSELGLNRPVDLPTGILIQSALFPDPSVVTINGYL
ncbi:MAG: hypothetical protein ACK2UK_02700, partial [Candidatus Promineifilaceae bacterium]